MYGLKIKAQTLAVVIRIIKITGTLHCHESIWNYDTYKLDIAMKENELVK